MGVNGIYGLSGSGLDVESMVKVGMMSKQKQLEKMQQTYTKNEWKKDAYLEVYSKIQDYSTSSLSTYKLSSNMNARTATSSNPLIKATANASAPAMNHNITVESTATNAYLVGTKKLTSTKLNELGVDTSHDLIFYIGDTTDTGVTPANYASATFKSNSDFFSNDAKKFHGILQTALKQDIAEHGQDYIDNNQDTPVLLFAINDTKDSNGDITNGTQVEITYGDIAKLLTDEDSTFQDFVKLLNKKISEANPAVTVNAVYDETNQSLTFTNNVAGKNNIVDVDMTTAAGKFSSYIMSSLSSGTGGTNANDVPTAEYTNYGSLYFNDTSGSPAALDTSTAKAKQIKISKDDIDKGATLYDLISAVNSAGTSIRATYDSAQNEFSFYNMKVGSANSIAIKIGNDGGATNAATLLDKMGLKDTRSGSDLSFTTDSLNYTEGTDAKVLVDGKSYSNISANNVTVNGVTYNFGNVTEKTSAVVTVEQDVNKIVDNVKSFVEGYNTLIGDLDKMYREMPNRSYAPLTDAQKAEMTEEQIKKWEEKAKSGMLYHDNTLRKIIDQMRGAVTEQIGLGNGYKYDTAYSIGISTKGLYGQIQLDEDKLRAALNDDPDSVYKVFATLKEKTDAKGNNIVDSEQSGIAQRLGQIITDSVKSINTVAGTSKDTSDDSQLSTLLRNLQTKMSNFQSMMNAFEESLYKKYDAMESTLAMLGSQLNYVTGMFA